MKVMNGCILSICFLASFPTVVPFGIQYALTANSIALTTAWMDWKWDYNFPDIQLSGYFSEQCHREVNIEDLERVLKTDLYGQHLVTTTVLGLLKGHLTDPHPSKPLVLSFHGMSSVGKSFVSQTIAEHLFEKGMQSSYVHLYMAPVHFPHHEKVTTYKKQLQDWVRGNITLCSRSIFIFDEVDKMHPGILNSITPFITNSKYMKDGDYNKAIYILLSNVAFSAINNHTYNHLMDGKRRSELGLKEMQEIIMKHAYNDEGDAMKKRGDYFSKYFDNSTKHSVLVILADVWDRIQHLPEMVLMLVVVLQTNTNTFNEKMASLIPLKDMADILDIEIPATPRLIITVVGRGLWHSEMISKGVISAYVPFLPLELEHVKDCIRTVIINKELPLTERLIATVAAEILFQPSDHPIFSVTGCRNVPDHVNFVSHRDDLG